MATLRGNPTLILDSCSVRAKRGNDLTGPNPTDRSKKGTKYHVAVNEDGVSVACTATAANVNDTVLFERLFLAASAVMATATNASRFGGIGTVFADRGYDAESSPALCHSFGAEPHIHKRRRWSATTLGCWKTSALPTLLPTRFLSSRPCLKRHASSWLQDAWPVNCENRLYGPLLTAWFELQALCGWHNEISRL